MDDIGVKPHVIFTSERVWARKRWKKCLTGWHTTNKQLFVLSAARFHSSAKDVDISYNSIIRSFQADYLVITDFKLDIPLV
jgi:hypothetical protein